MNPLRQRLLAATIGLAALTALPWPAAAAAPVDPAASAIAGPTGASQASVVPDALALDDDIRPARAPLPLPPGTPWALIVGLGLGALATALAVAWLIRRRPTREPSPFERALAQLEVALALIPAGQAEPFSVAISGAVRTWLEAELALPAGRQTTLEFLRHLAALPDTPIAPHRALLSALLERLDLAKFAGWSLTAEAMDALHEAARRFITAAYADIESARAAAAATARPSGSQGAHAPIPAPLIPTGGGAS